MNEDGRLSIHDVPQAIHCDAYFNQSKTRVQWYEGKEYRHGEKEVIVHQASWCTMRYHQRKETRVYENAPNCNRKSFRI